MVSTNQVPAAPPRTADPLCIVGSPGTQRARTPPAQSAGGVGESGGSGTQQWFPRLRHHF